MKGIAITLATRADAEAIERIEKLIGHKIPRAGAPSIAAEPVEKMAEAKKPETKKREAKERDAKTRAPKAEPKPTKEPACAAESSPVLEDIKSDWNGPLPSFLSVSAV
jgi:superfamily II DNA/RNA helicase